MKNFLISLLGWIAAAAACAVLSIVLIGLPGAVVLTITKPVVGLFFPHWTRMFDLSGDTWPAALIVSLYWPIGLVIGYLVSTLIARQGIVSRRSLLLKVLGFAGGAYVWMLLLSGWMMHVAWVAETAR